MVFLDSDIVFAMSGSPGRSGLRMWQIKEVEENFDHQRV